MTTNQIREMFQRVNQDCKESGEQVVPITFENADYYRDQMENLGFVEVEIAEFIKTLH